jgi:hypothetical protein
MRKTILVVASVALAMVVLGGVAWAANIQCPNGGTDPGTSFRICNGTDQDDTMRGTGGNDLMYGFQGNDTLYGYGERDIIYGDTGRDTAYGGGGKDALYSKAARDTAGEYGPDNSNDFLHGGRENDHIYAGASSYGDSRDKVDRVYGERGNDFIYVDQTPLPEEPDPGDPPPTPITKEIVDCGSGWDTVIFDQGLDVVKANCERKQPQ